MEIMSALASAAENSGISGTPVLSWLPDSVLLEVLSFLSIRDLVRSGRVCKRWRRLIMDKTLWRHINLTPYKLNSKTLWHLIRHKFVASLQTLKLKGMLQSVKKQEFLTPAILQEMEKRFPHLKTLHLEQTNLHSLSYYYFPSTLKTLELSQCELPMNLFKAPPNKGRTFPKLEHLFLSNVSSFSNHHVETICSYSALKTLSLCGTYRVKDVGIQKSLPFLRGLEHLKLQGCDISDITLHLIGCHLKHLRTLALTDISSLTDAGLACLSGVKTLEKLLIEYNTHLSLNSIIAVCVTLPALGYLSLNGKFEGRGIDELKKSLPNCKVTN
nr:F-box and leucine-rich repeat protein 12 [Xenopus laevis]